MRKVGHVAPLRVFLHFTSAPLAPVTIILEEPDLFRLFPLSAQFSFNNSRNKVMGLKVFSHANAKFSIDIRLRMV